LEHGLITGNNSIDKLLYPLLGIWSFSPAKLEKETPIILIDFELLTIRHEKQA
jgi:hypothetical protein